METVGFFYMASSASIAACMAELITLPIDTAKVRMQVGSGAKFLNNTPAMSGRAAVASSTIVSRPPGFIPVLVQMARHEGISAWWKGLPAGLHRQFIYATLRISMYPHIRDFYSRQKALSFLPDLGHKVLAGMSAGAIGMTIANPTDVVKVRLQSAITTGLKGSTNESGHTVYSGAIHAYRTIIKEEGVLGLWRGLGPNIVRNAIVCSSEMVAYDELKTLCLRVMPDGLTCHCLAGFGAGFIATVVGSPIDVVKTRYMNARPGQYKSVGHAFIELGKEAGPKGFYRGFAPNVLRIGTFNMLVFVFYEQILRHLRLRMGDLKQ